MTVLLFGVGMGLGAALSVWSVVKRPPTLLTRYLGWLEVELRFLRSPVPAGRFLGLQILLLGAGSALKLSGESLAILLLILGAGAPVSVVVARHKRIVRLEAQVEGWLGALGRALEASPSLGEGLSVSAEMVDTPLRDEIEQTLSEINLGLPLDRALSNMSQRVRSRTLNLALTTLEVGRETGGELPSVLHKAMASLREMTRLEGVLRTKTAEGKMQAMVISGVPFALYLVMQAVDPEFFLPLETTPTGHLLLGIAVVLWLAAGFLSFKILSVQL